MTTIPTTIAVSSQNWNGKSWTRRSVAGSNRYDPAGKKTSWKSSNSRSKATSPTTPTTTTPIVSPIAPPRTARHVPARSRPPARGDEDDDGDRGEDPEAAEHGPDVGHVGLFALVEDRRAVDLDVEAPAEDEVGQDRVGRRSAARRR